MSPASDRRDASTGPAGEPDGAAQSDLNAQPNAPEGRWAVAAMAAVAILVALFLALWLLWLKPDPAPAGGALLTPAPADAAGAGMGTADGKGTGTDESRAQPAAVSRVWTRVLTAEDPFTFEPHAPVADGRTAVSPHGPDLAGTCHACHGEIVAEWSRGQHALAWIDEHYQASLADLRRPEACYGCHAPEPLHAPGRRFGTAPYVRDEQVEAWHFGVSCATCHLGADGETWLGPHGSENAPHPTARGESFVGSATNQLCIDCHRTDVGPVLGVAREYERSDLAATGVRCVDCHFAPVERASAPGSPVRVGRSHELLGPRDPHFLAQAFAPRVEALADGGVAVLIENRAGHRVPGLVGRELHFEATALDAAGVSAGRAEWTLGSSNPLQLGETRRFTLASTSAAERVRLRAHHAAPGWTTPVPFLDVELKIQR